MQVGQAAPLFLPVFPRQKFRMQVLMQALLPDGPQVSLQVSLQVLMPDGPQVSLQALLPDGPQVLLQALLPDGPQVSLQVLMPDGPQVLRASPGAFCTSAEAQVCDDVCAAEVQNGVPHAHVQAVAAEVQAQGYKQHHQQYIRSSRQADRQKTEFSTFSCFVYSAAALPY